MTSQSQQTREQLARLAVERLSTPLVIITRAGTVVFWNQAAEHTFGYRMAEAEGRALDTLITPHGSNGQQASALSRAAAGGAAFFITAYTTKSGRTPPLAVAIDAVSEHSGVAPAYLVLTARAADLVKPVAPALGAHQELDGLTVRQREVLGLIAEGWSTRQIAEKLKLSVKTVETHRAHLMQRLRVDSVAKLVRYAVAVGLVPATL